LILPLLILIPIQIVIKSKGGNFLRGRRIGTPLKEGEGLTTCEAREELSIWRREKYTNKY